MRHVSISAVIIAIVLAFLVAFAATADAWTVTVQNGTPCTIRVKVLYGALGKLSQESDIVCGGTQVFDVGAECPLKLVATFYKNKNTVDTCTRDFATTATACIVNWSRFDDYCTHACWDSRVRIFGYNREQWKWNY